MAEYEKKTFSNPRTGDRYYCVKHPSGLEILMWPMEGFSAAEALFGTKYGSVNTRFQTDRDENFVEVPEGIAHFLEHKLFENEDTDVFELYAKTGANANAYTSFDQTCYTFSTTKNFKQALEILLDFVQQPYFTQETVDKEQGIIGQEIRLCEDNPDRQAFFRLLKCLYVAHPVRIDIAGTVDSIAKIDAQLLYRCYYTFYNLNNMVLSVAGNFNPDELLAVCDEHLKPCEDLNLVTDFPEEPETVAQARSEISMPVGVPLFNIGYKAKPYAGKLLVQRELEASILLQMLFGSVSPLYRELFDEGLINSQFSSEVFSGDGFFSCIVGGESKQPDEVYARIKREVARVTVEGLDRALFDTIKKQRYGSMIRSFNNVEYCAELMLNTHLYGVNAFDSAQALAEITFESLTRSLPEILDNNKTAISIVAANEKGGQ